MIHLTDTPSTNLGMYCYIDRTYTDSDDPSYGHTFYKSGNVLLYRSYLQSTSFQYSIVNVYIDVYNVHR